jgi:hypothetical protein
MSEVGHFSATKCKAWDTLRYRIYFYCILFFFFEVEAQETMRVTNRVFTVCVICVVSL